MNSDENSPRKVLIKIFSDVVCLLLVGVPILLFYLMGEPFHRGYYCDDTSLRYPYKESTVPSWALYIFGLGLPIITIILTEMTLYKYSNREKAVIFNRQVPSWIWDSYQNLIVFGFGAASSQLITDIAKYTIGRLRPHFHSVCQSDFDCSNMANRYKYIENYHCKGTNKHLLKDMRLSFPSGHSSFSTYCMIFLAAYIHYKINWAQAKLFKHVLQFFALCLAIYTSLSRVTDYKHHWSDVLAGVLQGAVVAILVVRFVSDLESTSRNRRNGPPDPDAADSGLKMDERAGYYNRS